MRKRLFWEALGGYLRERLSRLAQLGWSTAVFTLVCWLCGLPLSIALYAAFLCVCAALVALAAGFPDYLRRYVALRRLAAPVQPSELPRPRTQMEKEYDALLLKTLEETERLRGEESRKAENGLETFSLWTHQIKTPISAMRLLLQDSPDAKSAVLLGELFQVEQYADMALNYARLNASSTDYVFHRCDLDALLRKLFRRLAPLFIQKKLRLVYEPVSFSLLTDEKWFSFAVEQLLSNALKYTRAGEITVAVDLEKETLTISDTGAGIAPEDLPRVFERGYTGRNGREEQRATGLGLYLCRRTLDRLGHSIALESRLGEGTRAIVGLKRKELDFD